MTFLIFILIIITELMAYFDAIIIMRLKTYTALTFNSLPYIIYTHLGYLIFGVFLSIIAKWMWRQKKSVSILLAGFNALIILLEIRNMFKFSAPMFILVGFYVMLALQKQKEN
ncbi:hypothetical protein [Anaerotignum sp.]|uniref:hypothetical protein n=1 Tax=Anaerotignum sp. TaxID=2039241 RepID=UPI0028B21989|nr:hypothetical protein [Anaerotignum sp.]